MKWKRQNLPHSLYLYLANWVLTLWCIGIHRLAGLSQWRSQNLVVVGAVEGWGIRRSVPPHGEGVWEGTVPPAIVINVSHCRSAQNFNQINSAHWVSSPCLKSFRLIDFIDSPTFIEGLHISSPDLVSWTTWFNLQVDRYCRTGN